jgi:hypothetical protein
MSTLKECDAEELNMVKGFIAEGASVSHGLASLRAALANAEPVLAKMAAQAKKDYEAMQALGIDLGSSHAVVQGMQQAAVTAHLKMQMLEAECKKLAAELAKDKQKLALALRGRESGLLKAQKDLADLTPHVASLVKESGVLVQTANRFG